MKYPIVYDDCIKRKKFLEDIYGKNAPLISDDMNNIWYELLERLNYIADRHNIRYSLDNGSLLGWARHQSIIPYDQDMDIVIGKDDIDKLTKLVDIYDWAHYNDNIDKNTNNIILVINRNHNKSINNRQRYNCDGKEVRYHIDNCSFNGPIARLINIKKKKHIDFNLYNHGINIDDKINFKKCNKITKSCCYINSQYSSNLPSVCESYLLFDFSYITKKIKIYFLDNYEDHLKSFYTDTFIKPYKIWKDNKWVKTDIQDFNYKDWDSRY